MSDILDYDLVGQAALIADGAATPLHLVDATIARIEAGEPTLNALTTCHFEAAREAAKTMPADTPFGGLPFLHKDLLDVVGFARSDGAHAALHQRPAADPPLVAALKKAGLIFIAATNTPEFASLPVTNNVAFGTTCNPWDTSKTAAGSSGGSAVALAAGYVAAAHATDGAGSIRLPSSFCHTFGFKPSRGRLLSGEADGSHPLLKHHHAITRSVRDSAWLFEITQDAAAFAQITPSQRTSQRLKIGLLLDNIQAAAVAPDIRATIEATARRLEDMGHEIVPLTLNGVDGAGFWQHVENMFLLRLPLLVAAIEQATGQNFADNQLLSPFTTSMGLAAMASVDETTETEALAAFAAHKPTMLAAFEQVDVLLTPVTPMMPFGHEHITPLGSLDADRQKIADMMAYMATANVYGLPAMSVPAGFANGLPIGAHFTAPLGDDNVLFQLAYALEEAAPWHKQGASLLKNGR
jgi:amidase